MHAVRKALGKEAILSAGDELRLNPDLVASDVGAFEAALAAGDGAAAVALYRGPFLDGFSVSDAPEFERWEDGERARLADRYARAVEALAEAACGRGDARAAADWWARLAAHDPYNARVALRLMRALEAAGDRAGAMQHARLHAALLRQDFGVDPDPAITELAEQLRSPPRPAPASASAPLTPVPLLSTPEVADAQPTRARETTAVGARRTLRRALGVAAAVTVLAVIGLGWRAVGGARSTAHPAPGGRHGLTPADSIVASRFYEEGLRALYQFDARAASRLFRAALREDSTSALGTYFAWRAAVELGDPRQVALADRAARLAAHAPTRDSLLIVTHVGVTRNDVAALSAARLLVERYGTDPELLVRAAEVVPDLPEAVPLLNRAIALDSAAGVGATAVCRLCDALNQLARQYWVADSLDAAERTIRRWIALRPADAMPWYWLTDLLFARGRRAEAEAAARRYAALGGPPATRLDAIVRDLRSDDVDAAGARCDSALSPRATAPFEESRWYCTIALRMQGRYRAALALVREGRAPDGSAVRPGENVDPHLAALLDFETGRPLSAADKWRAYLRSLEAVPAPEGVRARRVAWYLTHAAAALVAGGDTARALALADSIESAGQRSLYARDPRLHHFVRGLLHAHAGRHEVAARELRASIYSPTMGYTRANYELGRVLLALHRPDEAIPVVRAALHGGIEGANLYVTRTELHELLARLFDAVGRRDSAAAHYTVVERAWRHADPPLRPRWAAARDWLRRPAIR